MSSLADRRASATGALAAMLTYNFDISSSVDLSFTSHKPAMTLLAPAPRKAQAKPTGPSPAYVRAAALLHAETVTSSALIGVAITSRAESLHLSGSPDKITAESSGLSWLALACAVKWMNPNCAGMEDLYASGRAS